MRPTNVTSVVPGNEVLLRRKETPFIRFQLLDVRVPVTKSRESTDILYIISLPNCQ